MRANSRLDYPAQLAFISLGVRNSKPCDRRPLLQHMYSEEYVLLCLSRATVIQASYLYLSMADVYQPDHGNIDQWLTEWPSLPPDAAKLEPSEEREMEKRLHPF